MQWSYGLTTIPERGDLLARTLASLASAGFDSPLVFTDEPRLGVVGRWMLSAWELYLRNPWADRFAVFQDDLVTCRNVRAYLEQSPYPDKGYLNLYTAQSNEGLAIEPGWFQSRDIATNGTKKLQSGRGALALVFSRATLATLFASRAFVDKPYDRARGDRSIDGAIVNAMNLAGWREYVHNPSLVLHTGKTSTMNKSDGTLMSLLHAVEGTNERLKERAAERLKGMAHKFGIHPNGDWSDLVEQLRSRDRYHWPEWANGHSFPGEDADALRFLPCSATT